jgi:hypothetical protein
LEHPSEVLFGLGCLHDGFPFLECVDYNAGGWGLGHRGTWAFG